ncbi:MAG: hypothetical protein WC890_04230 [Candidatus Margulisiibacteriota bacterium]
MGSILALSLFAAARSQVRSHNPIAAILEMHKAVSRGQVASGYNNLYFLLVTQYRESNYIEGRIGSSEIRLVEQALGHFVELAQGSRDGVFDNDSVETDQLNTNLAFSHFYLGVFDLARENRVGAREHFKHASNVWGVAPQAIVASLSDTVQPAETLLGFRYQKIKGLLFQSSIVTSPDTSAGAPTHAYPPPTVTQITLADTLVARAKVLIVPPANAPQAEALLAKKQFLAALFAAREVLLAEPHNRRATPVAINALANIIGQIGRVDSREQAELAKALLTIKPDEPILAIRIALFYANQRQFEAGLAFLDEIHENPLAMTGHLYLAYRAIFLRQRGNQNSCLADLQEAYRYMYLAREGANELGEVKSANDYSGRLKNIRSEIINLGGVCPMVEDLQPGDEQSAPILPPILAPGVVSTSSYPMVAVKSSFTDPALTGVMLEVMGYARANLELAVRTRELADARRLLENAVAGKAELDAVLGGVRLELRLAESEILRLREALAATTAAYERTLLDGARPQGELGRDRGESDPVEGGIHATQASTIDRRSLRELRREAWEKFYQVWTKLLAQEQTEPLNKIKAVAISRYSVGEKRHVQDLDILNRRAELFFAILRNIVAKGQRVNSDTLASGAGESSLYRNARINPFSDAELGSIASAIYAMVDHDSFERINLAEQRKATRLAGVGSPGQITSPKRRKSLEMEPNPGLNKVWGELSVMPPEDLESINPLLAILFAVPVTPPGSTLSRQTILDRRKRLVAVIIQTMKNGRTPTLTILKATDPKAFNGAYISQKYRPFLFPQFIDAANAILELMKAEER